MARDPNVRRAQEVLASTADSVGRLQTQLRWVVRNRAASIAATLDKVDWPRILEAIDEYQRLVPDNMSVRALAALKDEQESDLDIPVAWVPRTEVVEALLLDCATREKRVHLLVERIDDILDDCDAILTDIDSAAS